MPTDHAPRHTLRPAMYGPAETLLTGSALTAREQLGKARAEHRDRDAAAGTHAYQPRHDADLNDAVLYGAWGSLGDQGWT